MNCTSPVLTPSKDRTPDRYIAGRQSGYISFVDMYVHRRSSRADEVHDYAFCSVNTTNEPVDSRHTKTLAANTSGVQFIYCGIANAADITSSATTVVVPTAVQVRCLSNSVTAAAVGCTHAACRRHRIRLNAMKVGANKTVNPIRGPHHRAFVGNTDIGQRRIVRPVQASNYRRNADHHAGHPGS